MKSDVIKKGIERAGQRALLHACGVSRDDMRQTVHRHRQQL
jgi:hypothetical protein